MDESDPLPGCDFGLECRKTKYDEELTLNTCQPLELLGEPRGELNDACNGHNGDTWKEECDKSKGLACQKNPLYFFPDQPAYTCQEFIVTIH